MRARVFTVRLDPTTGTFDDSELAAFLEDHSAVTITEHAFTFAGVPTLAVVLRYQDAPQPAPRPRLSTAPDLTLSAADRALFEVLRSWRNQLAKKEGRPAYVLFTTASGSGWLSPDCATDQHRALMVSSRG